MPLVGVVGLEAAKAKVERLEHAEQFKCTCSKAMCEGSLCSCERCTKRGTGCAFENAEKKRGFDLVLRAVGAL
jgi:hypothetical protein